MPGGTEAPKPSPLSRGVLAGFCRLSQLPNRPFQRGLREMFRCVWGYKDPNSLLPPSSLRGLFFFFLSPVSPERRVEVQQ